MVASSSTGFFSSMTPRGQAVDEQHDVRPAGIPVLRDCELVDGEEVVVGGIVEVQDADLRATEWSRPPPCAPPKRHRPACGGRERLRASRVDPSGLVSLRWASSSASAGRPGVQVGEGFAKPALQHTLAVVRSLGVWPVRSDVRSMSSPPAQALQPVPARRLQRRIPSEWSWSSLCQHQAFAPLVQERGSSNSRAVASHRSTAWLMCSSAAAWVSPCAAHPGSSGASAIKTLSWLLQ